MPKELFDQQLVTELDDNDRLAAGTPGAAAGKNITWKTIREALQGVGQWGVEYIDSATITEFVADPHIIYLIDATTSPVLAKMPDVVSGNIDEFWFSLIKDTHKVTITTIGGTQYVGNDTRQIIPTIGAELRTKGDGVNKYNIITDTRQLTTIVNITSNRDFTVDGFENNINYLINPNGGEITILFPTATSLPGDIAIKSHFEQVGPGRVSYGAVSGNIGNAASQVTSGDGQGFDIIWCNEEYSIQNDTRPKQLTASLASYPVSELSTITDQVRGTFFNQRVTTIEDSRFDKVTAVETSTIITANPTDPWQCFSSSITDEGVLIGDVAEGIINLISNSRRTGINVNIYFQYLKRDTLGNYTSIAQSSVININSDTTSQYIASATHALFSMLATDRIVVRGYARKSTTGSNPTLFFSVEGPTPSKSVIEVSAGTIAHNTLAGRNLLGAHSLSSVTGANIYNGQFTFSGQDSFIIPYARAITLTNVIKSATITDLRIGKNGGALSTITFPYSISANDIIQFAATYDRESVAYFTLIGTKLD